MRGERGKRRGDRGEGEARGEERERAEGRRAGIRCRGSTIQGSGLHLALVLGDDFIPCHIFTHSNHFGTHRNRST